MVNVRNLTSLLLIVAVLTTAGGQAHASSKPIMQELRVTAVVPAHRDIIVDLSGRIIKITSNTREDVAPTVYTLDINDSNRSPLTEEMYANYRKLVPQGTDRTGVLYQMNVRSTGIPVVLNLARGL